MTSEQNYLNAILIRRLRGPQNGGSGVWMGVFMTNFAKGLLAATALITLPSMAQSAVITSNTVISVPVTTSGLYINVVTGVRGTTPSASPGWDLNPWGTSAVRVWESNDRRQWYCNDDGRRKRHGRFGSGNSN